MEACHVSHQAVPVSQSVNEPPPSEVTKLINFAVIDYIVESRELKETGVNGETAGHMMTRYFLPCDDTKIDNVLGWVVKITLVYVHLFIIILFK